MPSPVRKLYALSPAGAKLWEYSINGGSFYPDIYVVSPPVIALDGTIYISSNRRLIAIAANGIEKWHHDTGTILPEFSNVNGPAIDSNGIVYYGGVGEFGGESIYAVNPNGTLAWSFNTTSQIMNQPIITPDGKLVFGATDTRKIVVLKASGPAASTGWPLARHDAANTGSLPLGSILGEAPTITAIGDQTVAKDGTSGPIAFTIGDKETFPGFLTVTADSSNKTFVPNAKVVLGGGGANRTVTVSPATGQEGATTITVTVKDSEGQTATRAFNFATAIPKNDAPTITAISNQTTTPGQSTAQISFTVADNETAASFLLVTSSSSNKTLVPDANVFLGGTGGTRTVLVTTAAAQEGTTTITLTITDGGPGVATSASTSFTVTSTAVVNLAPTISSVGAQTTDKNTATTAAAFTVGDTETAVASLTVAGVSSNTTLVPNANIAFSGTGAARTVVVTSANNQVGTATITLTVVDGGSKTASTSFTLTVNQTAPTKGDFDADGKSDILFQDSDGYLAVWAMNGVTLKSASFLTPSNIGVTNYRIAGTGDFNHDDQEDILFQHKDGALAVWYMSGTSQTGAEALNPSNPGDKNWQVVGVADINKDGNADLVLQHTDVTLAVWYMKGINLTTAALLTPSTPGDKNWRVVGLGDFNGDGNQDLAFQHTDGTLAVWYMNGAALTQATLLTPSNPGDSKWRVIGVADRNGDGKVDLLFQHTDYSVAVWNMNGITLTSAQLLSPSNSGATWKAAGPK